MVFQARDAERFASFEDRRMWRLLLARLHPDAGGDHDLFAFACAVRDEMSKGRYPAKGAGSEKDRSTDSTTPFLLTWQEAMDRWSSSNHDALTRFRAR